MIERQKAMEAFKKYVAPYDVTNEKIALKIAHTYRTAKVSEEIAKSLELNMEDVDLAWLIGLLHDIGRFEQLRIYDTFDDSKSINHASFGVKVLFQDGLIRKFIEESKYDDIIYKAIENHNKYLIEEGLEEKTLIHAKIIRDADKTDILKIHVDDLESGSNVLYHVEEIKRQKITPQVLEQFLKNQPILSKNVKKDIDHFVLIIGFIYDYHYQNGLEIVKKEKYIERMIEFIKGCKETEEQTELIKQTALDFLEKNIK